MMAQSNPVLNRTSGCTGSPLRRRSGDWAGSRRREKRQCAGAIVSRAGCRGRTSAAPVEWVGASIATGGKVRPQLVAVRRHLSGCKAANGSKPGNRCRRATVALVERAGTSPRQKLKNWQTLPANKGRADWLGRCGAAVGVKVRQSLPADKRRAGWGKRWSVAGAGLVRSNRRDGRQNRCGAAVSTSKQRQLAAVGNLTT